MALRISFEEFQESFSARRAFIAPHPILPEFVCLHGFPSAGAWGASCDRGFLQDLQESGSYGRGSAGQVQASFGGTQRLLPGLPWWSAPRVGFFFLMMRRPPRSTLFPLMSTHI